MPRFAIPSQDNAEGFRLHALSAVAQVDLSAAAVKSLRDRFAFKREGFHVGFREEVTWGEARAELSGLIGFHDLPSSATERGRTRGSYAHVDVELRTTSHPRQLDKQEWDLALAAAVDALPMPNFTVTLRSSVASDAPSPVKLPITLSTFDALGFSEISGVRLTKRDTGDDRRELYSVGMDLDDDELNLYTSVSVGAPLNADLLVRAFERALEVTKLAVWVERAT